MESGCPCQLGSDPIPLHRGAGMQIQCWNVIIEL